MEGWHAVQRQRRTLSPAREGRKRGRSGSPGKETNPTPLRERSPNVRTARRPNQDKPAPDVNIVIMFIAAALVMGFACRYEKTLHVGDGEQVADAPLSQTP